jgi:hypothetical protein
LNYKSDVDFIIGAYVNETSTVEKNELVSVRATSQWKKIYVTFSTLGGITSSSISSKVYIHAELGTLTTANLFFDNLKVIY